ncbi:MAG: Do family serine endopeptidase [Pirellulales bacterium]
MNCSTTKNKRTSWIAASAVVVALGFGASQWLAPTVAADPETNANVSHAKALSKAFRNAAHEAMPSVVTIRTKSQSVQAKGRGRRGGENPFKGTPFEDFFSDDMERFGNGSQRPQSGVGSGVIIDRTGIVLTNNHVVEGADEVIVRLSDGREYKGTDVKTDPQTDLAIVRIKGEGDLPFAKMGDSDEMEIGDWVIAVGNPFELETTVSAGIISGKGRELGPGQRTKYLQTDAAINPGNSGGPLLNLDGEVIGINTAIATTTGQFAGVGFAIPINLAKWVTSQLVKTGEVHRAYLGVQIGEITPDLAEKFGVKPNSGVLVGDVLPNAPAAKAGMEEGDVVTAFAGRKVSKPRDLQEAVERCELGSTQKVEVIRDGKPLTLEVAVAELPKDLTPVRGRGREDQGDVEEPSLEYKDMGLSVGALTDEKAKELSYQQQSGVLITGVDKDSLAFEKGLREDMLILKVDRQAVTSVEEFEKALEGASLNKGILLQVYTPSGKSFVVLKNK